MARFRTRARTVDMLGRQQIAGLPTAINELFKNAHDAYANVVEVDYYRPENLFVLRDDGLGMTLEDFESRWLAIGTESKLADAGGLHAVAQSLRIDQRQVLGEKGIGRLAIGAIGPQVLICTRALRSTNLSNTVVAFVNWTMYTIPGIDIEEIVVPVAELGETTIPSAQNVAELVQEVRLNLMALHSQLKVPTQYLDRILGQLNSFTIDPEQLTRRLGSPSLLEGQHGTQFYISPVSDNLALDIDASQSETASPLSKMLTGFSNTMVPNHETPVILAEFRDHKSPGITDNLISERTFFTPEDFLSADHTIRGTFDQFGQFEGIVTLYGSEPIDHIVPWLRSHGRPSNCGPFAIDLAYVQGNLRDSSLLPEQFAAITKKLELFGGIYIYRDGIRVLPYGNQDYDFLRIEERRNKSAGYYYFSYRRLFGVISISYLHNANLIEKAGREGFQENLAYREFKDILENFFIQTAASFFRADTPQGELFIQKRTEIQKREEIARRREQAVRAKRQRFERDLDSWFSRLASGDLERETAGLIEDLRNELHTLEGQTPTATLEGALHAEQRAYDRLHELRDQYRVVQPRGIGLTRNLRRHMDAYRIESDRLTTEVFMPTELKIAAEVDSFSKAVGASIDARRRLERTAQSAVEESKRTVRRLDADARKALDEANSRVRTTLNQSNRQFINDLNAILTDTQRIMPREDSESALTESRRIVEHRVEELASNVKALLEAIALQLDSVSTPDEGTQEFISQIDYTEATEEELLALRETAEENFELVQLGQAVEAINHEFETTIIAINNGIRDLESWARTNRNLEDVYGRIRAAFDHLNGYLNLFVPLRRRADPVETDIKGQNIVDYVGALFTRRLAQDMIQLNADEEFQAHVFRSFRSAIYPAFVNLVDNAIFWLSDHTQPRTILLHLLEGEMAVSDNGPGVAARDQTAIFDSGFTRKPGGRGLGLYISRDVLSRAGYDLVLSNKSFLGGATFIIQQHAED